MKYDRPGECSPEKDPSHNSTRTALGNETSGRL